MRVMAIDLEMNQPSRKIIQIGAVCFQPDTGRVVGTFNRLVNPGEHISEEIIQLTGIKNEDVADKPTIIEAANELITFKAELQINPIAITWGGAGSKTNDVSLIYEESYVESPFRNRIIDTKSVFQMLANVSSGEMRQKVGLHKACNIVGIGWDELYGKPHDALADAHNTMRIYMFLSKCLKGGYDIKRS